ncbi:hypothetical protein [Phenylobacterium deserti]|uniref:Uncharacterized protein n=1 Tax=Phenylobacterium deserti TaxID=1914756 RepID=A0A328ATW4_9CAUL|nr:hypothetical protein [Phenylobacterium deserti]RAK56954.1 hypothetical protein DJ018_03015 [Phenylobacterium deserti]
MRFELQQVGAEWIVARSGVELARFESQQLALEDVAARLEAEGDPEAPNGLSLNFARPAAADET